MKNKQFVNVKNNSSLVLKQHILIPNNIGMCISCGADLVTIKSESDDKAPKNNPAQE